MQRRRERSKHWSHRYLKRINSTEVTLKREVNSELVRRIMTAPDVSEKAESRAAVVYRRHAENARVQRTPERVLKTPGRTLTYVTAAETTSVPMTPRLSSGEVGRRELRSRKRLFD